jgi:NAD+ synthase
MDTWQEEDLNKRRKTKDQIMITDCEQLISHLCNEIQALTDIAVIGLSGGADSTLAAVLCRQALGKDNVYGISMPYNQTDIDTFNSMSANLAEQIEINHFVKPVAAIADAVNDQIHLDSNSQLTPVNKGNARSRARMCILFGIAHSLATSFQDKRVRVIGTGNLSEDFIGYDTKGGDALADFFPIGELFKSEVYQLLEHFRDKGVISEENINRSPSAGLEDNQTDEDDLGHTYNDMEAGVRLCLKHYADMANLTMNEITEFVWKRHLAHKHKHEAPFVIKLRQLCE